ncbi:MAG: hypothetical protein KIT11_11925 [Fimbriimonadaceae bacterium]|nr:hypothetical protein [Fimbriimonadaceae bacterium]QYK55257.1 MAG: hypothetical protein KF733_09610 [Fimbriimonadaceae bacterium]
MTVAVASLGYLLVAGVFYALCAGTAMRLEEEKSSLPSRVVLQVVEGGLSAGADVRRAA